VRFVILFFAVAVVAGATPIQLTFTGVNGANDWGYYVGPYYGQFGSTIIPLNCDDFANDVNFGQKWEANLSTIVDGSDLSATRYGTVKNALTLYQEIAYLDTQYAGQPTSQYADIQATIWDIFDPKEAPKPGSDYWLLQAEQNYRQISFDSFRVITNVGPVLPTGQVQEFITILAPGSPLLAISPLPQAGPSSTVPEPGSLLLIGSGVLFGVFVLRKVRNQRVK
jgi:hypothetical protein